MLAITVRAGIFYTKAEGRACNTGGFRIWRMLGEWVQEYCVQGGTNRTPISPKALSQISITFDSVCTLSFETKLFQAVSCLSFFSALSVSQLLPGSRYNHLGKVLQFRAASLRSPKTAQRGWGLDFTLSTCIEAAICPVGALCKYIHPTGAVQALRWDLTHKYQFGAVV